MKVFSLLAMFAIAAGAGLGALEPADVVTANTDVLPVQLSVGTSPARAEVRASLQVRTVSQLD